MFYDIANCARAFCAGGNDECESLFTGVGMRYVGSVTVGRALRTPGSRRLGLGESRDYPMTRGVGTTSRRFRADRRRARYVDGILNPFQVVPCALRRSASFRVLRRDRPRGTVWR